MPTLVCRSGGARWAYFSMRIKLSVEIGKRVREHREAAGLTQEQLAHQCGWHRTYVGMIERAEKRVSVERLAHLCKALKTTLSDFLDGL